MSYSRCMLVLPILAVAASFAAFAQTFVPTDGFPPPAPGKFTVVGTALPDGRLLVWDGLTVYRQSLLRGDAFEAIATDYDGDPAFIALSPDKQTALLGQGYLGDLYTLDLSNPEDFSPESVVANLSHYSGLYLTDSLVLLDTGDFSGSELAVIDISGAKANMQPVLVVTHPTAAPKSVVVEKPAGAYSASLALDEQNDIVYAFDGNTRELRFFAAQELIEAYTSATPLEWSSDGTLVGAAGDFFSNGVNGITPEGNLIISGSLGFLQPGGIQVVDPRLDDPSQAVVLETLDPKGNQSYYSVIYNPITDSLISFVDGEVYVPEGEFEPVPAASVLGLLVLGGLLATAAAGRTGRK